RRTARPPPLRQPAPPAHPPGTAPPGRPGLRLGRLAGRRAPRHHRPAAAPARPADGEPLDRRTTSAVRPTNLLPTLSAHCGPRRRSRRPQRGRPPHPHLTGGTVCRPVPTTTAVTATPRR